MLIAATLPISPFCLFILLSEHWIAPGERERKGDGEERESGWTSVSGKRTGTRAGQAGGGGWEVGYGGYEGGNGVCMQPVYLGAG